MLLAGGEPGMVRSTITANLGISQCGIARIT
jgi:hypothetical protein